MTRMDAYVYSTVVQETTYCRFMPGTFRIPLTGDPSII